LVNQYSDLHLNLLPSSVKNPNLTLKEGILALRTEKMEGYYFAKYEIENTIPKFL